MVAGSDLPQAAVTISQVQTEGSTGDGRHFSTVEFKVSSPGIVNNAGIKSWQINFPST
jgi:hypothetical protein